LGVGSSVSAFDGYADRVSIAFGDTPTTYNFVPTPGAAAALGLTALFGLRRRRSH
jgi:MYXO-CTERM domain-containing protein